VIAGVVIVRTVSGIHVAKEYSPDSQEGTTGGLLQKNSYISEFCRRTRSAARAPQLGASQADIALAERL